MTRSTLLLFAGLLPLVGCAGLPEIAAPSTVRALRFRQFICESGLEFVHGGGGWYDSLFLPDHGIVCRVLFSTEVKEDARGQAVFVDHETLDTYYALGADCVEAGVFGGKDSIGKRDF